MNGRQKRKGCVENVRVNVRVNVNVRLMRDEKRKYE